MMRTEWDSTRSKLGNNLEHNPTNLALLYSTIPLISYYSDCIRVSDSKLPGTHDGLLDLYGTKSMTYSATLY